MMWRRNDSRPGETAQWVEQLQNTESQSLNHGVYVEARHGYPHVISELRGQRSSRASWLPRLSEFM